MALGIVAATETLVPLAEMFASAPAHEFCARGLCCCKAGRCRCAHERSSASRVTSCPPNNDDGVTRASRLPSLIPAVVAAPQRSQGPPPIVAARVDASGTRAGHAMRVFRPPRRSS